MSVVEPTPAATPTAAPRPAGRPLRKRVAQFLRRAHLYVGLFMIPWVLVYAVTGFLLNHHTVWADREVRSVTTVDVRGTGLDALPSAVDLATDVTAALNARPGGAGLRLTDPTAARFDFDTFPIEAKADGREVRVNLDAVTRTGHVSLKAPGGPPPSPFDAPEGVFGGTKLEDRLKAGAPPLFRNLGVAADQPAVPWLPELVFRAADADGREWVVRYDPKSGAVKGRAAADADPERGFKRFLYTLHFTHGYPESVRLRWVWAVFVDLTVVALVFWCLTGLVMWWQIKAVRRAGVVVLVSSVLTAAVLGVALRGALSS